MNKETSIPKLIESIKVLDGQVYNLAYHKWRMSATLSAIYNYPPAYDIEKLEFEQRGVSKGLYKLRVVYDALGYSYTFQPYIVKPKNSLKVVFDDTIDYNYKSENRHQLKTLFEKRQDCDDILIVKNNLLTDSYYCNIALEKEGSWYTPAQPLLAGTKRAQLLDDRLLEKADIYLEELHLFSHIRLFNAMIEFGEVELGVGDVR